MTASPSYGLEPECACGERNPDVIALNRRSGHEDEYQCEACDYAATCRACGKRIEGPVAVVNIDGELMPVCTFVCLDKLTSLPAECALCREPLSDPKDRLPWHLGESVGRVHSMCAGRLSRAFGMERAARENKGGMSS